MLRISTNMDLKPQAKFDENPTKSLRERTIKNLT